MVEVKIPTEPSQVESFDPTRNLPIMNQLPTFTAFQHGEQIMAKRLFGETP